ncbi:SDR family NAD(P)-dependent oxidoreductase [Luteipulveratus halotolerans]|uniref:Short-chain dehydrogenase n=1 Tax=Luteipulveratus halotolerans TaxID=1631356 RepID=A0A0L6CKI3_9MICO|nr:SDR family NAD(P)-dependent oxidoreductase [Luteipulveratus halotolerans]KNX38130.1 hypothetical protein VV01_14805 [Luteipulveratus halotolerans]
MDLQHKVVWVVGASSGIGAALAREAQARGAKVAITARREAELAEVSGGAMLVLPADVTDAAAMVDCASTIEHTLGPIDVVVIGAGAWNTMDILSWDTDAFAETVQVNLVGTSNAIGAVLPSMLRRRTGVIAGITSPAGYRGFPTVEAYGATKAGMLNLLEGLRAQGNQHGIHVTTIAPTAVRTRLSSASRLRLPFSIDPDVAGRAICDGLERERVEIAFPHRMALPLKLIRMTPVRVWPALADRLTRDR